MAYTKTTWVNGETPINADNLNNIETGVSGVIGTILWTNPDPTADFSSQNIALNSSDYDVLEFVWLGIKTLSIVFSERVIKGHGTQFDYFQTTSTNTRASRRITYVNNTSYTVGDCNISNNSANNFCIPLYVIGYKTGLFGGQS